MTSPPRARPWTPAFMLHQAWPMLWAERFSSLTKPKDIKRNPSTIILQHDRAIQHHESNDSIKISLNSETSLESDGKPIKLAWELTLGTLYTGEKGWNTMFICRCMAPLSDFFSAYTNGHGHYFFYGSPDSLANTLLHNVETNIRLKIVKSCTYVFRSLKEI